MFFRVILFRHFPVASDLAHKKSHTACKDILARFDAAVRVDAMEAEIRIFVTAGKIFFFC